ncbi:MAG: glycosyltransferase family 9 protein [Halopseudomonas sp.]
MIPLKRMRRLDRWLGIPLLALISGWLRIKRLLGLNQSRSQPKHVLVLLLSEMGSLVLAEPALRKLQDQQGVKIGLCLFQRNAACLSLLPWLQQTEVFVIRDQRLRLLLLDVWRFRRWCRQHHFDAVIDMELFSRFSGWLSVLSGAPIRVGFDRGTNEGLYRGTVFNYPVCYNAHLHMAHNYQTLVEGLSEADRPYVKSPVQAALPQPSRFEYDPACQRGLDESLAACLAVEPQLLLSQSIVLVNVGASDLIPQRNWPTASQVSLCRMLLAHDPQLRVVLCGSEQEQAVARRIEQLVDDHRCRSMAGQLQVAELPYLYRRAALMVTPDSGPAHFAAVTSMPVLVLFGPETPSLYRPLGNNRVLRAGLSCSPCVSAANHRLTLCRDNQCMALITPEQVCTAAVEMLARTEVVSLMPQTG